MNLKLYNIVDTAEESFYFDFSWSAALCFQTNMMTRSYNNTINNTNIVTKYRTCQYKILQ